MDRLHVHQVLDLLRPLIGHTGTLFDQLFIITDLYLLPLTADHQIIVLSPLVGEPDIEPEVPVDDLLKIDPAHIIPPGGYILEVDLLMLPVLHRELCPGAGIFSQHPAVQRDRIFPYPDHIDLILHMIKIILSLVLLHP